MSRIRLDADVMTFSSYRDFLRYLESIGDLKRVTVEVDPFLEITEIATRALREKKPALLFENEKILRQK